MSKIDAELHQRNDRLETFRLGLPLFLTCNNLSRKCQDCFFLGTGLKNIRVACAGRPESVDGAIVTDKHPPLKSRSYVPTYKPCLVISTCRHFFTLNFICRCWLCLQGVKVLTLMATSVIAAVALEYC